MHRVALALADRGIDVREPLDDSLVCSLSAELSVKKQSVQTYISRLRRGGGDPEQARLIVRDRMRGYHQRLRPGYIPRERRNADRAHLESIKRAAADRRRTKERARWEEIVRSTRWLPTRHPGYEASECGQILEVSTGRVLPQSRYGQYLGVWLHNPRCKFSVHRLVCEAWHGPAPGPKPQCRHLDGDPHNNAASNLRWGSAAENAADMITHGTRLRGERVAHAILTEDAVRVIRHSSESTSVLSHRFNVSMSSVSMIRSGRNWPHVPMPPQPVEYPNLSRKLSKVQENEIRSSDAPHADLARIHNVSPTTIARCRANSPCVQPRDGRRPRR